MRIGGAFYWAGVLLCAGALGAARPLQAQTNAWAQLGHGTVTDEQNQPVANAQVECFLASDSADAHSGRQKDKPLLRVTTDARGRFKLANSKDASEPMLLVVRKKGFALGWQRFSPALDSPLQVTLAKPVALAGTVVDAKGNPVKGAHVVVQEALLEWNNGRGIGLLNAFLPSKWASEYFNARTDAQGRFELPEFPAGASAKLLASARGCVSRMEWGGNETLSFAAGRRDIRLELEPVGCIRGRVELEGAPGSLAQAEVCLGANQMDMILENGSYHASIATNGTFCFSNLPPGSYGVWLRGGRDMALRLWASQRVGLTVEAGQTNSEVVVEAVRAGTVQVSLAGEAQPGQLAQTFALLLGPAFCACARFGGDGKALLSAVPGQYQVMAVQEEAFSIVQPVTIEVGSTNQAELRLEPPRRLSGRVVGSQGQPVVGAWVSVQGGRGLSLGKNLTQPGGLFTASYCENPDHAAVLVVRDLTNNEALLQTLDAAVPPQSVKLLPALSLVVRVSSRGRLLTNGLANVVCPQLPQPFFLSGLKRLTSAGEWEIAALPPGYGYQLSIAVPGYGTKELRVAAEEALPGRKVLEPVDLVEATLSLSGQVVDVDNKPVAGASVLGHGADQPGVESIQTDRLGRFRFQKLCPGSVQVTAIAGIATGSGSQSGSVLAEAGQSNVVVCLGQNKAQETVSPGSQLLTGRVLDPQGRPDAAARVKVFDSRGGGWKPVATNGCFSLNWSSQSWQPMATLVAGDDGRGLAVARELSEEMTNLDLVLEPAKTLAGVVRPADGAVLTNALVSLWLQVGRSSENWQEQPVRADALGRFQCSGLPAGATFIVRTQLKDWSQESRRVRLDSMTNLLQMEPLVVHPATSWVRGQVLDAADKPVAGAFVSLNPSDHQPEDFVHADKEGRFQFKVCQGPVLLYANNFNIGSYGQAHVQSGDTNVVICLENDSHASTPARFRLTGSSLPDLRPLGLASNDLAPGKPVLLCLLDLEQRPSRHVLRRMVEQAQALQARGVTVLAIQAALTADEAFKTWLEANPVAFPVGRLKARTASTAWVTQVQGLPYLVLTDSAHKVISEGFSIEQVEEKLKNALK